MSTYDGKLTDRGFTSLKQRQANILEKNAFTNTIPLGKLFSSELTYSPISASLPMEPRTGPLP